MRRGRGWNHVGPAATFATCREKAQAAVGGRSAVQRTRLTVDELDMRILREVLTGRNDYFRGDRQALDDIARILGIHRTTVWERVSRMETNGFLLPLTLEVEPGAVGLVAAIAALDVPVERRTAQTRAGIFELEGVWGILTYLDAWVLLVHGGDDAVIDAQIREACKISGATVMEIEGNTRRDYPDVEPVDITPLDVRIIATLMQDARASFRAVADEIGVTARTVERHYARLQEEGVVMMVPTGGAGASGLTMADLRIELPDVPEQRRAGIAALEEAAPKWWFRSLRPHGLIHIGIYSTSASELDEVATRARAIPGARRVGLRVWTGQFHNPAYAAWLVGHLEARAGRARRSS